MDSSNVTARSLATETPSFLAVVGAGQIGAPLVRHLARAGHRVRWLSRTKPAELPVGVEHVSVDVRDADALARAVEGTRTVIAAVNPSVYDAAVWARDLPPMHRGLIDGVGRAGARLVTLDALYLYALDQGPLSPRTPETASNPKGRIRKQIADMLMDAHARGAVRATTLRASDFWGPGLPSSLITPDAIDGMRKGKRPLVIGDGDAKHAFSHRDDVVEALANLALAEDDVLGRVFHAPVVHVTPRALVAAVAKGLGVDVEARVAPSWLLRAMAPFSRDVRSLVELLPQWDRPYLVDDGDYCARFGVRARTVEEGVATIVG